MGARGPGGETVREGLARMFGPKFNANTQATFDAAQSATTGNVVVGS